MAASEVSFRAISQTRALLRISEGAEVYVRGKVRVAEVVGGTLRVLGSTLTPSTPPSDVYSPRGYSLLNMRAVRGGPTASADKDEVSKRLEALGLEGEDTGVGGGCLVVLERLGAPWSHVLDHYLPLCQHKSNSTSLFTRDSASSNSNLAPLEKALDVNLWTDTSECKARIYRENPQWDVAVKSVKIALNDLRQPRIILAGGKGVGKSTFLRYLTNRILDEVGPLVVIDLDPGQAEFTLPGCISAVRVDAPVLGPNFANQLRPKTLCLDLGEINVSNISRRFTHQMARLVKKAGAHPDLDKLPWVVNTMGFNRGLGVKLMGDVVAKVGPSTLVEIRSRFESKNYNVDFDKLTGDKCNVLQFEAVPEDAKVMGSNDLWGIPEPSKLRDIVVLSYFGHLMHRGNSATFFQGVKPFKVSWSDVKVRVLHSPDIKPAQVPALLNMSLVSLGKLDGHPLETETTGEESGLQVVSQEASVDTFGFGFVRGIDVGQKLFYVVTPLRLDQLKQVDCLSVGAVGLPKGIILSQTKKKRVPYRSDPSKPTMPLAQPWQRYSKPKNFDSK